jgi:RNA polymerase sigma factor (sigma-70 family)
MIMASTSPQESQEALVHRALRDHEGALVAYAVSIMGDLDRARDAVQDTIIKLWQQEAGKVNDALKSWLYTVCRNRCLDLLRRDRRLVALDDEDHQREIPANQPTPDESIQSHESQLALARWLNRLPANQKEVIRLKFQGDLSYKEISDITGLTETNVGFLIHTGLRRLRTLMGHERDALG